MYQVTVLGFNPDGSFRFSSGTSATACGPSFQRDVPGINAFTRFCTFDFVLKKDARVYSQHIHFADTNFFSFFTFPLLSGNPGTALSGRHDMVLTEETAKKYFGTADAVGKTLEFQIDNKFVPFTVTAVARNCPQNSSIQFDVVLPLKSYQSAGVMDDWMNRDVTTFLLLDARADEKLVATKMARVYQIESAPALEAARSKGLKNSFRVRLEPLNTLHLSGAKYNYHYRSRTSDPLYGYILSGIAGFILLIACINFINLTIAQSQKRGKEIGVRKVIGGSRSQLIRQLLGESFVTCGIAFALAIGLALLALPMFNQLAGKQLSLSYLLDVRLVALSLAFYLLTAFTAGFYPALVLSGFNPLDTLYHRFRLTGRNYLGKSLAVLQFSLAGVFIIGAFFMSQQFYYLTHKDLGYNDHDLVTVNTDNENNAQLAPLIGSELLTHPSIRAVTRHNSSRDKMKVGTDSGFLFSNEYIDENYFSTLQIPVIKGRPFSADHPADSVNSVIINETFAELAGWQDPIGQSIESPKDHKPMTVVGVVRDFHYYPLTAKIEPQLFTLEPPGEWLEFDIRIADADKPATLRYIEKTFKKFAPYTPFTYSFRQDDNRHAYDSQEKWRRIVAFAAIFTLFISCIGLFGLAMLATQRRVKEIGIRKVLGASVPHLVRLLSVNFLQFVLLANLIAIPVAWWAVNKWLQNFAYRITLQWWVFASAILISLLIAAVTVGGCALQAAVANPMDNLRVE
jgi:putative ABC transport system permease protein